MADMIYLKDMADTAGDALFEDCALPIESACEQERRLGAVVNNHSMHLLISCWNIRGFAQGTFLQAERMVESLTLPLDRSVTDAEVGYVIDSIRDVALVSCGTKS